MRKCQNCERKLSDFYYLIGNMKLCKGCSLELALDISCYKVNINNKSQRVQYI